MPADNLPSTLADHQEEPKTSIGLSGLMVVTLVSLFLGILLIWANVTLISGAVVASGNAVVRGKPKQIQHLDGGIVERISVNDGDVVQQGQSLIKLDDTLLLANLKIYRNRLNNSLALRDRLEAEQVDANRVEFAPLPDVLADFDPKKARAAQIAIFESRRAVRKGQIEQLREKIRQFENQIDGTNELITSKEEQRLLINQEIASMEILSEQKLLRDSQILAAKRSRADLLGQLGEHRSELARIQNSIRDANLEILQTDRQAREEAVTALSDVNSSIDDLIQQILSTQKQLDRVEIKSPVDGIVHELQVTTIGGVVPPGATIVQIIPTGDGVVFETRVDPASIDQLYLGQDARVMLPAFNQRTTPELNGLVSGISPDVVVDEASGLSFYKTRIQVNDEELARLDGLEIIPGMPVEAFIQTKERTVLSYLAKPLTDQVMRAFREE